MPRSPDRHIQAQTQAEIYCSPRNLRLGPCVHLHSCRTRQETRRRSRKGDEVRPVPPAHIAHPRFPLARARVRHARGYNCGFLRRRDVAEQPRRGRDPRSEQLRAVRPSGARGGRRGEAVRRVVGAAGGWADDYWGEWLRLRLRTRGCGVLMRDARARVCSRCCLG